MAGNVVGSLLVNLGLETGRLRSDTDKASRHFNGFDKRASRSLNHIKSRSIGLTGAITTLTGVAGVLSVAGFGSLVKSSSAAADELGKTADKIGISSEKLAQLQHITEQFTNVGAKAMNEALTKATKRLGEFNAAGGGAASKWLKELNLDTKELAKLAPDQLFNVYSSSIRNMTDRGQQLAAISALMGDESRSLINIIDAAPEALNATAKQADALGLSLSRFDISKIEAMNDSLDNSKKVFVGVGNTLSVSLSPYITAVANSFVDASTATTGFKKEINSTVKSAVLGFANVLDATDSTLSYISSNKYLAETGIIGFALFGKKGFAAVLAGQALIETTARLVKGTSDVITRANANQLGSTEGLANARKRLIVLEKEYSVEVQRGLDGSIKGLPNLAEQTLKQLKLQTQRVSGIVLLSQAKATLNNETTKEIGLLAQLSEKLKAVALNGYDVPTGSNVSPDKYSNQQPNIPSFQANNNTDEEQAKLQERLGLKLDSLTTSLLTEEGRLFQSYANRQLIIEDAFDSGLIGEQRHQELILDLDAQFEKKRTDLTKKSQEQRNRYSKILHAENVKDTLQGLQTLTSGVSQNNKALFNLNKTAGIAEATINAYRAFGDALATGGIFGYAKAAAILATGLANVQNIASTSFGGGGGSSPSSASSITGAGSVDALPQSQVIPSRNEESKIAGNQYTFFIEGSMVGEESVREVVIKAIEDAQNNDELTIN